MFIFPPGGILQNYLDDRLEKFSYVAPLPSYDFFPWSIIRQLFQARFERMTAFFHLFPLPVC